MLDPISPQELDKLINSINRTLFDKDPLSAFCMISLLTAISEKWDSGQMEESFHKDLLATKEKIENIMSLQDKEKRYYQLSQLIKNHIVPLRLIHGLV